MRAAVLTFTSIASLCVLGGCLGLAGASDYRVDECFDGCGSRPGDAVSDGGGNEGALPGADGQAADARVDGAVSAGLSNVSLPGTGIPVGRTVVATLTARNSVGDVVPRVGAKVEFSAGGGTSVVAIGPTTDYGDGTYRAVITGVAEGTKLSIGATIDGTPITSAAPSLRVVNPVNAGLTLSLDAENADASGNSGARACPGGGLSRWTDSSGNGLGGDLVGFSDPCNGAAGSGWGGSGEPGNPRMLAFDGVDDYVTFGPVNSLIKQTVLVWMKKTGSGIEGSIGNGGGQGGPGGPGGGLSRVIPLVTKGSGGGENNADSIGVNFYLALTRTGQVASDYQRAGSNNHVSLTGATAVAEGQWTMVGLSLDAAASTRVLWLDGKADATATAAFDPVSGAGAPLVIGGALRPSGGGGGGGGASQGRFKGGVAIVRTYDRALSAEEIRNNCHAFSARFGMMSCPD